MNVSQAAREGIDFIFTKAAKANLVLDGSDTCVVESLPGGKLAEPPERYLFVLTISSYLFRVMTIFHVADDRRTRDYFSQQGTGPALDEAFGEVANLCCGAMNRDLGNYFSHLGMSTPFVLDRQCIPFFMPVLKPAYVSQHKAVINGDVTVHATLCVSAYATLDFRVDTSVEEESTGELEMF